MAKGKQGITLDKRINDLYDKYPIMERLDSENVFCVDRDGDGVMLMERCDDNYAVTLTKEEVKQVAHFFLELAKYM